MPTRDSICNCPITSDDILFELALIERNLRLPDLPSARSPQLREAHRLYKAALMERRERLSEMLRQAQAPAIIGQVGVSAMQFGQPCTRCGKCCKAIPCGIAYSLLGQETGSCRALEQQDDQYACGLLLHVSHYVEMGQNTDWKDEMFGMIFGKLLGIGWGCCSSPQTMHAKRAMADRWTTARLGLRADRAAEGGNQC